MQTNVLLRDYLTDAFPSVVRDSFNTILLMQEDPDFSWSVEIQVTYQQCINSINSERACMKSTFQHTCYSHLNVCVLTIMSMVVIEHINVKLF